MKTTYDLMIMCGAEYFKQLERWCIWVDTHLACNLCAMAYDYIARGDY